MQGTFPALAQTAMRRSLWILWYARTAVPISETIRHGAYGRAEMALGIRVLNLLFDTNARGRFARAAPAPRLRFSTNKQQSAVIG